MLPKLNVEVFEVPEILDRDSTEVHTEFLSLDSVLIARILYLKVTKMDASIAGSAF